MTQTAQSHAVLIGDVAASRSFDSQSELFDSLLAHFEWVNRHLPARQPLQFTVGDEFQAAYAEVGDAFRAALLLQLRFKQDQLKPSTREQVVRIGLACGDITVFDAGRAPFGQSGDAWWHARRAIEQAEQPKRQRGVPYAASTRFFSDDALLTAMANACLLALDQVLYGMDRKDVAITLGLLTGHKQREIAEQLGISQPVVSRRSKSNGAFVIERVLREFEQVGSP